MTTPDVVAVWRDPVARALLDPAVRAALPASPVGAVDLPELATADGGEPATGPAPRPDPGRRSGPVPRDLRQDPRWWAGLTLEERTPTGDLPVTPRQRSHGEARQRLWAQGRIVPGVPVTLAAGDATTDVAALLGEDAGALRHRYPDAPDWLDVLAQVWPRTRVPDDRDGVACTCAGRSRVRPGSADSAFLRWPEPLLAWGRAALRARLPTAVVAGAGAWAYADDTDAVLRMIRRVLVLELHVARERGTLCGDTPAQRFGCFAHGLTDPGNALALLAAYPVLARDLVAHVRRWVDVRAEFVTRLAADLPLLRDHFGLDSELSAITGVAYGVGDAHRGGRSVAVVTAGRHRVVYKPRSLATDRHLGALVDWVNDRGLEHPLRPARSLDRGPYGWCEFVEPRECPDPDALARFYWRHGAYLALFYALRAYDMHLDNVIAAGEDPVFVDLEALFHAPADFEDADAPGAAGAGRALRESVLAILLLPQRHVVIDQDGVRGVDLSGLAGGPAPEGEPAAVLPHRVVDFADAGTDLMRVVKRWQQRTAAANRPRLAGATDAPVDSAAVRAGFASCYRLLLAHRPALIANDGPIRAFAGDAVRTVLRSTNVYRALLDELWHPDLLRDGLDRDHLLDALADPWRSGGTPEVAASERRQLAGGDTPAFGVTADGTTLFDPFGDVVEKFLDRSGLRAALDRLDRLSERDLDEQLWFAGASLATLDDELRPAPPPVVPVSLSAEALDRELAVAAARRIADRLVATALPGGPSTGPDWLTLNLLGQRHWVVGSTDIGLANGVTGIALFLATLDGFVDEPRYRRTVDDLTAGLLDPAGVPEVEDLRGMSCGGFEDLGALLHLVVRLHELAVDPSWLPAADWLVAAIAQNLSDNDTGDVVSGTAGAALALSGLRRVRPGEDVDALLRRTAHRLCTTRPAATTGFGRGTSGAAYALAVLAESTPTGDAGELRAAAVALLDVERLALRGEGGGARPDGRCGGPAGWCTGVAGTALARAAILALPGMAPWHAEIADDLLVAAAAVQGTLIRDGAVHGCGNDSLCHGDLGLVDALLVTEHHDIAQRVAAGVARRVLAGRIVTGAPTGVWVPGLLTGAAGVGYGLLRAATPDRFPSVLLLQTRTTRTEEST